MLRSELRPYNFNTRRVDRVQVDVNGTQRRPRLACAVNPQCVSGPRTKTNAVPGAHSDQIALKRGQTAQKIRSLLQLIEGNFQRPVTTAVRARTLGDLEHIATRHPVPLRGGYRGPFDQNVDVVWLAGVLEETGQACA